ncbi:MAG: DUF192 domain-containing protein [Candidatus Marsarchaeota archaeon]|nr:DUF192 domain-containing protein [Candidatus Marsarchaeota archaeon]
MRNKKPIIMAIIAALALSAIALIVLNQNSLDGTFSVENITIIRSGMMGNFSVYVATTTPQQTRGYMYQKAIGDCDGLKGCIGMIFVFPGQSTECFWMENTIMPLRQSWISNNGVVGLVYNATPYSTNSICSAGRMVLETLQNFSISPGDEVIMHSIGT